MGGLTRPQPCATREYYCSAIQNRLRGEAHKDCLSYLCTSFKNKVIETKRTCHTQPKFNPPQPWFRHKADLLPWMDLHNSEIRREYGYYVKSFCYFTDDKKTPWHFPDRTISYQCLSARLKFMSTISKTGFDWSYDVKSYMYLSLPSW